MSESDNPEMGTEEAERIVASMSADIENPTIETPEQVIEDDLTLPDDAKKVDDGDNSENEPVEDETQEPTPQGVEIDDDALFRVGDEVISGKDLKAQRLMRDDYTRKTMALSDERKAAQAEIEQERARLQDEKARATSPEVLEALMAADPILLEAQSIDWEYLKATDPAQYLLKREEIGERQSQWADYLQQVQSDIEARELAAHQEIIAQNRDLLVSAIPEIASNPEPILKAVTEIGLDLGFSIEELGEISDYRFVKLAYEHSKALQQLSALKGLNKEKPQVAPIIRSTQSAQTQAADKSNSKDPEIAKLAKLAVNGDKRAEDQMMKRLFG